MTPTLSGDIAQSYLKVLLLVRVRVADMSPQLVPVVEGFSAARLRAPGTASQAKGCTEATRFHDTVTPTRLVHCTDFLPDGSALVFERVPAEVRPARELERASFFWAFMWPLEGDTQ